MADPNAEADQFTPQKLAVAMLVVSLMSAIPAGLIGAFFLPGFLEAWGVYISRITGALLLIGVAIVGSCLNAVQQYRRKKATRQAASELGMEYARRGVDEHIEDVLREMFTADSVSLKNVMHKDTEGARLRIGDLECTHRDRGGDSEMDDSEAHTTRQTVAYFESDEFDLPEFTLQPEGTFVNVLSGVFGVQDIDFDDHPEFSRRYHLSATYPEGTRQLFNQELLDYFARHPGLQVKARGKRLVVFRPDELCPPEEIDNFASESMTVFRLFRQAAEQQPQPTASETAEKPDARAAAEELSGIMGFLARRSLVTTEDVDRFLYQPAPRSVPAPIRRQLLGGGNFIVLALGGMFTLVGGALALAGLLQEGAWVQERILLTAFGGGFLLIGLITLSLAFWYRQRQMRLLRDGIATQATIDEVERTNFISGNQRQYELRIRYDAAGKPRTANCYVLGTRAYEEARQQAENGEPVKILYDPSQPQRIVWTETLVTVSPEYA